MDENNKRFLAELGLKLQYAGFSVGQPETTNELPVIYQGTPLCVINAHGVVSFSPEIRESEETGPQLSKAIHVTRITSEYMNAVETAPPLAARELSGDYYSLAEYNGTVLAAHPTKFGAEFVTWEWINNHRSLWQGHYFQDYERAKTDFAVRSGLVQADRIFSDEQLAELYRCAQETLDGDTVLTDKRRDLLSEICWKIDASVPDLDERVQRSCQAEKDLALDLDQTM